MKQHPKGLLFYFHRNVGKIWLLFNFRNFCIYAIEPEGIGGGLGLPDKVADDIFGTYIALYLSHPFWEVFGR